MNCKLCGYPMKEEEKFCPNCGEFVHKHNKTNKGGFVLVAILVTLVIGVAGYFLFF